MTSRRIHPRSDSPCRHRAALTFATVVALLPTFVLAQTSGVLEPTQLKAMTVDELLRQEVLSVSRRAEPWGAAPSNVFLISSRAAAATGARTLPDLLRLAPNLFVAQASSYQWGVEARGFMRTNGASNKLLVLVDGRTAYSPLFSNVFWESTDVFLPDVDRVEVISGPSGANWGVNAVNGVINITSKPAGETLGTFTQLSGGVDGTQLGMRHGISIGRTGAVRFFAKRTDLDPTYAPAGVEDNQDAWHSTLGGFRADWGDVDTGAFTLQGDALVGRYDARPRPRMRSDGGNLIAKYARTRDSGAEFWVRGYYDYVLRDINGTLTETTHTLDIELQESRELAGAQALMWGANFRRLVDTAEDSEGFVILPERLWLSMASAFVQHDLGFGRDRFRFTSGLRFEHNDFSGWEVQPTVRLAWHDAKQTAWASFSRASRVPSRLDTGFHAPESPPWTIAGGPGFRTEKLDAYELGWRGQPTVGVALTATLFYHDYEHLRTVEPTAPIVQANGGAGRSVGSELFLDYDVTGRWRLRAGGFIVDQDNWLRAGSADIERGRGESSFPDYQFYLRNTFRLTPRSDLWLSLRSIGALPATEDGGGRVPAYTELDACWRWRFRPGYEFSIAGRNLLDRSHPEIGGLNIRREIPRSVYASVRFDY